MADRVKRTIFLLFILFLDLFLLFGGEAREKKKILVLGDSHAYALKDSFSPGSEGESRIIEVKGVSSSGLARRDYYDWLAFARSQESSGYDLYVVILGTNDGQNSTGLEKEAFGTIGWEYLYTARLESFITALKEKGEVLWVSIPPVADENLMRKTEYVQALIDEVCRYHQVGQMDPALFLTGDFRREDGIHLTGRGIGQISQHISGEVKKLFPY